MRYNSRDKHVARLAASLGKAPHVVASRCNSLAEFAELYVPSGDFSDVAALIENAATWDGEPGRFFAALLECGILEGAGRLAGFDAGEKKEEGQPKLIERQPALTPIVSPVPALTPLERPVPDLPPVKPSSTEIARRLENEPETAAFFLEAQKLIGTFGHPEQASLMMCHDYYGISWGALLVLLHAVPECEESGGRVAIKTYETYAKKLYAAGALKPGEAERFFAGQRDIPKLFRLLSAKWGLTNSKPTPAQREKLERWHSWGFGPDMIDLAWEAALDKPAKRPFSFADKVLEDWHKNGIATPDEVARNRAEWAARLSFKPRGSAANSGKVPIDAPPPSYDLEVAERLANRSSRTLKKNTKKKG
ncbi:MAG: DnaD domain protein [Clostridium sp.]|jgi:DnaD/phage-associated family protein|nr:DnaD domain protein [Clostridium sp.]